jgi:hypothetical protein
MSPTIQSILTSLEQLPSNEQHQLMLEFLRRINPISLSEMMDDDLIQCAEAIFLELDRSEAQLDNATI